MGNCKIDSVLLLCQTLLCYCLRAQKVEFSGSQCGQSWEQAAQFADMESSVERGGEGEGKGGGERERDRQTQADRWTDDAWMP